MKLQMDVGNSFLKWRLNSIPSDSKSESGRLALDDLLLLPDQIAFATIDAVELSSVAGPDVDARIRAMCIGQWQVEPRFALVAPSEGMTLIPAYVEPGKLGIDRWVAMLAARAITDQPALVVDAGSAITVDEIDAQGQHLGGYILPGYRLLQSSLLGGTAKIRFDEPVAGGLSGGKSTAECVASGAELVFAGLGRWLSQRLHDNARLKLIVTGGDGERILEHLDQGIDALVQPDLVMDGLSWARLEELRC